MVDYRKQDFETCMVLATLSLTTGEAERIGSELLDLTNFDDLLDGTKQIQSVRHTSVSCTDGFHRTGPLTSLTPQPPRVRGLSSQAG